MFNGAQGDPCFVRSLSEEWPVVAERHEREGPGVRTGLPSATGGGGAAITQE
jgi:hypothetical protein